MSGRDEVLTFLFTPFAKIYNNKVVKLDLRIVGNEFIDRFQTRINT